MMRKFKFYDTWINIILALAGIIFMIVLNDKPVLLVYFVIGVWQCISMVVHYFKRWFMKESCVRRLFHQIALGVFCIVSLATGISFFIDSQLFLLIVLIILYGAAPILALIYTCICYNEIYIKMQRPLAQLR